MKPFIAKKVDWDSYYWKVISNSPEDFFIEVVGVSYPKYVNLTNKQGELLGFYSYRSDTFYLLVEEGKHEK